MVSSSESVHYLTGPPSRNLSAIVHSEYISEQELAGVANIKEALEQKRAQNRGVLMEV